MLDTLPVGDEGSPPSRDFGDYEIQAEIARGGMGVVYRARQISLDRVVALKMILAGRFASEADVRRFQQEARAAANLDHPNIVPIYEVGDYQGQHFYSMKWIEGGSLASRLPDLARDSRRAVELLSRVARTIHHAHQRGILHRDIKPANILLDSDGTPLVVDFGLARALEGSAGLTQSGAIVGTPSYAAPEQARGVKGLSTAVDVYALGAVLYELLTQRPPFLGEGPLETLLQVLEREPVPPRKRDPAVDPDLETVCLKCLNKDPQKRYGSAETLADDLDRWLRGEPIEARRTGSLERAVKWCRRRPAVAGLLAVTVLMTLSALAIISVLYRDAVWQAHRALQAEARARKDRDSAQKQKVRAQEQKEVAEMRLYANEIQTAQREWQAGRLNSAWSHLESCPWRLRGIEHRLLYSLFTHNQVDFPGHTGAIHAVAFSPDGKRLISGGSDDSVRVWDAETAEELKAFTGPKGWVKRMAVSLDGTKFATAGTDRTVKVWEVRTGKQILGLPAQADQVYALAWSPDGNRIVTADSRGGARVWDTRTGEGIARFTGHTGGVMCLAFSPDGKWVVSGGGKGKVRVWNPVTGKERFYLGGHSQPPRAAVFSPDGRRIITTGADSKVKVWDAGSGERIRTLNTPRSKGEMAISPDGKHAVLTVWDGSVQVWDLETGSNLRTLPGHPAIGHSVAISADGTRIASGGFQTLKVWPADPRQDQVGFQGDFAWVKSLALSPDDRRLYISNASTLRVIDVQTGRMLFRFEDDRGTVLHIALSGDGKRLVGVGFDNSVRVWDAHTGKLVRTLQGHSQQVFCAAIGPGGSPIVSASHDRTVRVWDGDTGQVRVTLSDPKRIIGWLALSPDGKRIAVSQATPDDPRDNRLRVLDAQSGAELPCLTGLTSLPRLIVFSPDGKRIIGGNGDHSLSVWDASSGKELLELKGHTNTLFCLATSADGRRIFSSSADETIQVWDAELGQNLLTLREGSGVRADFQTFAVSCQGRFLVASPTYGKVKIWQTEASLDSFPLERHTRPLVAVAVSADSNKVLGRDEQGTILTWDAESGQMLREEASAFPSAHGKEITSPDGSFRVRLGPTRPEIQRLPEYVQSSHRQQLRDRQLLSRWASFDPGWHRYQADETDPLGQPGAIDFHLSRLLRVQPFDATLQLRQAEALARLGRRQEAATHLMHALFLAPRLSLTPVDPQAKQRAHQAVLREDWEAAAAAFARAVWQPGATEDDWWDLILAQAASGADTSWAVSSLLDRLPAQSPRARGFFLSVVQPLPCSAFVAEKMLALTGRDLAREKSDGNRRRHGIALYRAGRHAEAFRLLEATRQRPEELNEIDGMIFAGMSAYHLGRYEQARERLARFEVWLRQQSFGFRFRILYDRLLREARATIDRPPPMPEAGS